MRRQPLSESSLPAGPGDAFVLAVDGTLRDELVANGWIVRSIPLPAGDLGGFGHGIPGRSADLVAVDHALSPFHHADKRAALGRVARWLRPGGILLIREPIADATPRRPFRLFRRRLVDGFGHTGPATVQFWMTAATDAGFENLVVLEQLSSGAVISAQLRAGHGELSDKKS